MIDNSSIEKINELLSEVKRQCSDVYDSEAGWGKIPMNMQDAQMWKCIIRLTDAVTLMKEELLSNKKKLQ